MFSNETTEIVHERMLNRIEVPIDKRQGSITYDFTRYPAIEFEQAYMQLNNVLDYGFAETSYGEYLEMRCGEVGLTRKEAVQATGQLTFTGPTGLHVPAGTEVSTTNAEDPIVVRTLQSFTFESASLPVTVNAIAVVGGRAGNAPADSLVVLLGDLSSEAITVTNEFSFEEGHEEESDEALKLRYKIRTQTIVAPGNEPYYRLLATSVPGVLDARVYPRWQGKGTVRIVCLSPNKLSPSATVIQNVIDKINTGLLLGVDPTIEAVQEVPIDIDVTLTLKEAIVGSREDAIEQLVDTIAPYLVEYFASLAFNDLVVRYSRIGDALLDAEPVLDYEDLRINGLTSNITVQDYQVPVLGRLSITIA